LTLAIAVVCSGEGPWTLGQGLKLFFTPGHTEGHCSLLYKTHNNVGALFSGDHIAYSADARLTGNPDFNW
jgi:glyoxylase-like metal-dependent hydrolase (beta-lactamase superfamily II)